MLQAQISKIPDGNTAREIKVREARQREREREKMQVTLYRDRERKEPVEGVESLHALEPVEWLRIRVRRYVMRTSEDKSTRLYPLTDVCHAAGIKNASCINISRLYAHKAAGGARMQVLVESEQAAVYMKEKCLLRRSAEVAWLIHEDAQLSGPFIDELITTTTTRRGASEAGKGHKRKSKVLFLEDKVRTLDGKVRRLESERAKSEQETVRLKEEFKERERELTSARERLESENASLKELVKNYELITRATHTLFAVEHNA